MLNEVVRRDGRKGRGQKGQKGATKKNLVLAHKHLFPLFTISHQQTESTSSTL